MMEADAAAVPVMALIHAASFPPAEQWNEQALQALLGMPGVAGLVSGRGGFILVRRAADEAEILTLAVEPGSRRLGVGRDLLAVAIVRLAEHGVRQVFLEVAETNRAAAGLYHAAGFRPVGRRDAYYPDGTAALVLARAIGRLDD